MDQISEQCVEEDCDNRKGFNSNFTKSRIIKNLLVLSVSFLVSFCASDGLVALQSTLNKDVGVICLALQYVCGLFVALLLPKYLIRNFGSKIVVFVSMLLYVPYVASNFYPHFSVMVPCSILLGFSVTLIWSSVCTYLNDISALYSSFCTNMKDENFERKLEINKTVPDLQDGLNFVRHVLKEEDGIEISKPSVLVKDNFLEPINTLTNDNIKNLNQEVYLKDYALGDQFKNNLDRETLSITNTFSNQKNSISQNYQTFNDSENGLKTDGLNEKITHAVNKSKSFSIEDQKLSTGQTHGMTSQDILQEKEHVVLFKYKTNIRETTTARFFGVFGGIYQICHILSNVISYFVLQNKKRENNFYSNNSCVCGSQFCDINSECFANNLQLPDTETRYTLIGIYVVMSLISALCVFFFLDDVKPIKRKIPFSLETALAIIKFQKNTNQVLLIPLSLFLGLHQAFLFGDFSKDYVGCAWGVNHVPLVLIAAGVGISLSSCLFGLFEKYMGRRPILLIAGILNIAVLLFMLTWTPNSNKPTMMFAICGLLGVVFGTIWCHLRAFIGIIFQEEEEAAFASYQVWHAIGCSVCYAYSNYICDYLKIYILLIVSVIGAVGYLLAERNYSMNKNFR